MTARGVCGNVRRRLPTPMRPSIPRLLVVAALLGSAVCAFAETAATAVPPKPKAAPKVVPPDINGYKTIIPAPEKSAPVKVAIYRGSGAPDDAAENVKRRVDTIPGATVTILAAEEVGTTDLKAFDVVVFPGGGARSQAKAIGEAGLNNVREYVRNGGGYVGVCAGAYLACSNFDWSLQLLNASTVSQKWMRGSGYLDMELTPAGRGLLGDVPGTFKVRYNNGPVFKPGDKPELPTYTPLAFFRSEVAENGTPAGVMVNSPAQAIGTYGKGRVFISSPHPENTPGLEHLIPRGILWAAGKTGASTP